MWVLIIIVVIYLFYKDFKDETQELNKKNNKTKSKTTVSSNQRKKEGFKSKSKEKVTENKHKQNKSPIYSKVFGVTYNNRQDIIKGLEEGQALELKREKDNQYDQNAIAVYVNNKSNHSNKITAQIGYIKKELAAELAPRMDKGETFKCKIKKITGKGKKNRGVNIKIYKEKRNNNDRVWGASQADFRIPDDYKNSDWFE